MFSLRAVWRALLAGALVAGLAAWDCAQRVLPAPAQASLSAHGSAFGAPESPEAPPGPSLGQGPGVWKLIEKGSLPIAQGALAAHASALVALPAKDPRSVLAFWFAGDRESAPNVQIAMSEMDRASDRWSPARMVVDRWEVADTLGFGLENYDGTGKWRSKDGKFDIDVSGTMPNGKSFQTPAEMRTLLLDQMPDFTRCITEKMLTYSLGRGLERFDRRTVESIGKKLAANGYPFQSLIHEIVQSPLFQSK
jgi:hypothetical protein